MHKYIFATLLLGFSADGFAVSPLNGCGKDHNPVKTTQAEVDQGLGKGFATVIKTCRMVPAMANGVQEGFKIFNIAKDSLIDTMGFANGDVLTKVNDADLGAPEKGFTFFSALAAPGPVVVIVKRAGAFCVQNIQK